MSDEFTIRPMKPADQPFVYRAWLEGYWPSFVGNLVMPKSDYLIRWHRIIEKIIAAPNTVVMVAHVEGDPCALLGFSAYDRPHRIFHWCYVKQAFRGLGIAKEMIGDGTWKLSHWSEKMPSSWLYCPQVLKGFA